MDVTSILLKTLVLITNATLQGVKAKNCTESQTRLQADNEQCCSCCTKIAICLQNQECRTNHQCPRGYVCCGHRCVNDWDCLRKHCGWNACDGHQHRIPCYDYCAQGTDIKSLTLPLIICTVAVFLIFVTSARMCKLMFCNRQRNVFRETMDGIAKESLDTYDNLQQTKIETSCSLAESSEQTPLSAGNPVDENGCARSYGSVKMSPRCCSST